MELTHRFTVPASVDETWQAFNDLESVAGCFPGATVTSVEGDEFKGSCKVKLGPIALVYSGSGSFVERDESGHRMVLEAKGKDKRGNGTAGATVTAVMATGEPGSTDVEVVTDLAITGKPAQFGRGMMQDVSDKLLGQFVECLESKVGPAEDTPVAEPEPAASSGAEPGVEQPEAAGAARPATPARGSRPRDGEEDSALDLGATLLPLLVRSYWKPLVGVAVGLLLLRRLLRRRSR